MKRCEFFCSQKLRFRQDDGRWALEREADVFGLPSQAVVTGMFSASRLWQELEMSFPQFGWIAQSISYGGQKGMVTLHALNLQASGALRDETASVY